MNGLLAFIIIAEYNDESLFLAFKIPFLNMVYL